MQAADSRMVWAMTYARCHLYSEANVWLLVAGEMAKLG